MKIVKALKELHLVVQLCLMGCMVILLLVIFTDHAFLDNLLNILKSFPLVLCIPIHVGKHGNQQDSDPGVPS